MQGIGPRWVCGILALACAGPSAEGANRRTPTQVTTQQLQAALRPGQGRPLLVHVWASWCAPCIVEWPALAACLREVAERRLDVVTVALDGPSAVATAAQVLARGGRVPGRSLMASPDLAFPAIKAVDPAWDGSVPTTLLIGREGNVVLSQRGVTRLEQLRREIDRLAPASIEASPQPGKIISNERREP